MDRNNLQTQVKKEAESSFTPYYIVRRAILPYWPIYLVCLILAGVSANVYLRFQVPIYQVFGKVLLKVEGSSEGQLLQALDVFTPQKSVDNELEVIRSRSNGKEVAKNLNSYITILFRGKLADFEESWRFPIHLEAVNEDSLTEFISTDLIVTPNRKYINLSGQKLILRNQLVKIGSESFFLTIDSNGLQNIKPGKYILKINTLEGEINRLMGNLNAIQTGKLSTIMGLTFNHPNIENAKRILNEFIKVYINSAIDDKRKVAQYTLDFIDDRLSLINEELDSVERKIEVFKTANGAVDVSLQSSMFLNNVKENDVELNKVNLKLAILNDIDLYVNGKGSNPGMVPSVIGFDDPVLLSLLPKLYDLEFEISKRSKVAGEKDEILNSLKEEILRVKSSIKENIWNIRGNLNITKVRITEELRKQNSLLSNIPLKERLLVDIGRQQNIKNEIFTFLLQKREESAIAYASTVSDSRVIEWAYGGPIISPKFGLTYSFWITLGLIFPLIFYIWRVILNPKIQFKNDIESLTSIPIIGEIMFDNEGRDFVVSMKDRGVIAESLRTIRTKLSYFKTENKCKVILLSSSVPGEGKSFLSVNLGISYSLTGSKVLLIGGDMRKPVLHKPFGISVRKGLSSFLSGAEILENVIFPSEFDNLFVMPSGVVPPNPSELLESKTFQDMLFELQKSYDVIIIDSPPLGLVSDAEILAQFCDMHLFVVRYGVTQKEAVEEVLEKARISGVFKNMGIIFNGIKPKGLGRYGYYGYSYNYGYGYGGYGYYGGRKKTGYSYFIKKLLGK